MSRFSHLASIGACLLLLASCGKAPAPHADTSEPEAPATIATVWPSTLTVFGDGFPKPGDLCRRIGESAATADFLDDSAVLVGCPGSAAEEPAATVIRGGGRVVGTEQNITLISVPQGDANVGMNPDGGKNPPPIEQETKGKVTQ